MTDAPAYEYREDYVTHWLPIWEQAFGGLRGTPGMGILEIGSYEGRSTVWFLENLLTADDASIVCVDPFYTEGAEALFDRNVALTGAGDKVLKIKRRSEEYLGLQLDSQFDLVYVDGGHDAVTVLFDGMFSWPKVKPGGFLMFDDYEWELDREPQDRPKISVDMCLHHWAGEYDVVHLGYQVIIRKHAS